MQDYFFKALLQSQAFNWDVCVLVAQSCSALYNPVDCSPPGSSVHGFPRISQETQDFPVGCHFLLQEIFLTQGLNPGLLHCGQILYHLSHQGSLLIGIVKLFIFDVIIDILELSLSF